MVASSAEKAIQSYSHRDMDGDDDEDIVIVYDDGYIDLLQNISGRFQRKQIIAYLPDLASRDIVL